MMLTDLRRWQSLQKQTRNKRKIRDKKNITNGEWQKAVLHFLKMSCSNIKQSEKEA